MQKTLVSARAGTCARASTSAPSAASAAAKTSAGRQMPTTSIAVAPRPPLPLVLLLRKSSNLVARASPSEGDQSGSGSDADASGSGGSGSANEGGESLAAREARLAALERGARRGGAARPRSLAASAQQRQQQQLQRAAASAASSAAGPADWPEGQLLPSGWERMSAAQKAVELYQGRRGFLFWASQAAWYSVIGVGFGWVLFRFVLPGIGLYKLANGLTDAPTPL